MDVSASVIVPRSEIAQNSLLRVRCLLAHLSLGQMNLHPRRLPAARGARNRRGLACGAREMLGATLPARVRDLSARDAVALDVDIVDRTIGKDSLAANRDLYAIVGREGAREDSDPDDNRRRRRLTDYSHANWV